MEDAKFWVGGGIILALCGAALAEAGQPSVELTTLSGQGIVTLERPARVLRMQVALTARHKDPAAALAQLKSLREAANKKLAELGAVKESIKFASPTIRNLGPSDESLAVDEVGTRQPAKLKGSPVTIDTLLTAEWPLQGDAAEDRLIFSVQLMKKIIAADLHGPQAGAKAASEEVVVAEELEDAEEDDAPGGPSFVFVAKISDEDQNQALAEAFAKARAQAVQLAAAAGQSLGKLRAVDGLVRSGAPASEELKFQQWLAEQLGWSFSGPSANKEALGSQPGIVRYHVMVVASYDLMGQ